MIIILKSGADKVFAAKCKYCSTEFAYELEDVEYNATQRRSRGIIEVDIAVYCPHCKALIEAGLKEHL